MLYNPGLKEGNPMAAIGKLSDRDRHRANCRMPLGECTDCLRFLGFKILAEKLDELSSRKSWV